MDSQCTAGPDGRCFPWEGLVSNGGCWYDECYTDSDCPSGLPCLCRTSASDNTANLCAFGGNCVLDSDCGPGGFCSPSSYCDDWPVPGWPGFAYYCHTAADTCINDTDCAAVDAGEGCPITPFCMYDGQAQHWTCNTYRCCPP
jgi:hypothetical protein